MDFFRFIHEYQEDIRRVMQCIERETAIASGYLEFVKIATLMYQLHQGTVQVPHTYTLGVDYLDEEAYRHETVWSDSHESEDDS